MSKIKKVPAVESTLESVAALINPAVESTNALINKAGQGWKRRTSAALLFTILICGGVGGITGCEREDDSQQVEYRAGEEIIYETANGELRLADVVTDHGTMLTIAPYGESGEIKISESKALGYANAPSTGSTLTFAKGRHLDAYGDKYAEIEFLHGSMTTGYTSPTGEGTVAAEIRVGYGTTVSGKEVYLGDERIYTLVRRSDYWKE